MDAKERLGPADQVKYLEHIELLEGADARDLLTLLNDFEKQNKFMNREEAFIRLLFELAKERRPRSGG